MINLLDLLTFCRNCGIVIDENEGQHTPCPECQVEKFEDQLDNWWKTAMPDSLGG